jgi:hypothetical protein
MLQTMAWSFMAAMCSWVMTSLLPVVVTKMSALSAAYSMVTDAVAFHRGLQAQIGSISVTHTCARRAAPGPSPCPRRRSRHHGDLAGDHHVGGALDAVHQRFAAAVEVVELALGDRVVDVDGAEQQRALGRHGSGGARRWWFLRSRR